MPHFVPGYMPICTHTCRIQAYGANSLWHSISFRAHTPHTNEAFLSFIILGPSNTIIIGTRNGCVAIAIAMWYSAGTGGGSDLVC